MFFFLGFVPGAWIPGVSVLLKSLEYDWVVKFVFLPLALTSILAPLVFGSMADNRYPANKIMLIACVLGTVCVWFAFRVLAWGWSPWLFIISVTCYGFCMAPAWGLSSVIGLACLKDPDKHFPLLRIGATLGWPLAGVFAGRFLDLTRSPDMGNLSATAGVLLVGSCFMLPDTPPGEGAKEEKNWKQMLGLDALSLFKDNNQRVFFITAFLSAIPLAAIYMHAPLHLEELGDKDPTTTLALGQVAEIFAMLMVGGLLTRLRAKAVLLIALIMGLLRFAFFGMADYYNLYALMVIGIPLQGLVFAFWYITGQLFLERRVDKSMRAQAQSLLNVIYGGIGTFVGTLLADVWYDVAVKGQQSWSSYWWGLFAVLCVSTIYFFFCYNSRKD